MVSGKKRLYVALYLSGITSNEERKYHWVFFVGPKAEDEESTPGVRYHVKNSFGTGWVYEEVEVADIRATTNLLARILIGKVQDEKRLVGILRGIPLVQDDPSWRCRTWVTNVLEAIAKGGKAVGTSVLDWAQIESTARDYVGKKTDAGRYASGMDLKQPRPTSDMLEVREQFA